MPNVYGYVRVSTRSQSYDGQVDMITTFCKLKEYTLVNVFADKASGKSTERTEYQKMLAALETNPQDIAVVIVTKIDRVGRNLRDLLQFIDMLSKKKVEFVAIQNNIDTTIKEGRLFLYLMGALSEYERELIIERTEEGRRRYIASGGKLGKPELDINVKDIEKWMADGIPITRIAKRLRVSIPTVYDRLKKDGWKPEEKK
ncbi:MAG: recombinase family protein [Alphaproteobacteria bacterium]|nr:recombinase family protein [Alphaproteobacteria bacterium]